MWHRKRVLSFCSVGVCVCVYVCACIVSWTSSPPGAVLYCTLLIKYALVQYSTVQYSGRTGQETKGGLIHFKNDSPGDNNEEDCNKKDRYMF